MADTALMTARFAIAITLVWATAAVAGPPVQEGKLLATDGEQLDTFGYSCAMTSVAGIASETASIALVGIPYDIVGTIVNKGSVNIYKRSSTSAWTFEGKLVANDGATNDYFGASVSVFGDTAVVGAPGDDTGTVFDHGSAYVFTRTAAGVWTQTAKLVASDGAGGDVFGSAAAITNTAIATATSGDLIVIGAWADDFGTVVEQGSAYIFKKSTSGVWAQEGKFWAVGADGAANEYFGSAVAAYGDRAVLGCPGDDISGAVDRGSAYIWKRASSGAWSQEAKIVAGDGAGGDAFAGSLAISADSIIAGAANDDFSTVADRGSAYVFVLSGTTWTQQAKIVAADGLANDRFGAAVGISGTSAIVTASNDDGVAGSGTTSWTDLGAAYLFERVGTLWGEKYRFTAADGQGGKFFGRSASMWGRYAVIGAPGDDIGTPLRQDQGSAYVFELIPTDCNNNGIPDAEDIASGIALDCNTNQIPDSCDIAAQTSTDVDANSIPDECQTDCNNNDLPDSWEVAQGTVRDCNSNGIPDSCDIVTGAPDTDADGRIDTCERALGDFDLNGVIDGLDMALILSAWGGSTPSYADLDGDGSVGGGDLTAIFSRWGNLP